MIATLTIFFNRLNNIIYSFEPPHINGKVAKYDWQILVHKAMSGL